MALRRAKKLPTLLGQAWRTRRPRPSLNLKDSEVYQALKRLKFFRLAGLLVLVLFLASFFMYLAEYREGKVQGLWDSVWWALSTITTVGYGDIVPHTVVGRLIGFGLMISGIVLVSLFTATIASAFVNRKIKEGKGLEDIRDKGHILVCGWNHSGLAVLRGLAHLLKTALPSVVLVNNLPREQLDSILYHLPGMNIKFVRGDFTKEEILARANLSAARSAIILADTAGGYPADKADERTIFGCMAIKTLSTKVHTCAELIEGENREHLKRANVDEVFVRGDAGAAFLAGAATAPGLAEVMRGLYDFSGPNKLWRVPAPERFAGQAVRALAEHYRERFSGLLIALIAESSPIRLGDILSHDATAIDEFISRKFQESGRDYFSDKAKTSVEINPPPGRLVAKGELAVVLAPERPVEASFIEKAQDLVSGLKG